MNKLKGLKIICGAVSIIVILFTWYLTSVALDDVERLGLNLWESLLYCLPCIAFLIVGLWIFGVFLVIDLDKRVDSK